MFIIIQGETNMSQTPTKPDRGSSPGMPRWVKIFGIILIVLAVAVVAMHLMGVDFGSHMPQVP
jgi:hypothetical protein